jgi:hypothetical protein
MRPRSMLTLGCVLAIAVAACGDNGTEPGDDGNGGAVQPIATGAWNATSPEGFSVVFTVNAAADYVTEVRVTFSGLSCGGQTLTSGTVTSSRDPGWAISNRQITFSLSNPALSITGTFSDNGTAASGTWQWGTCSGTWTASHA